MVVLGFVVVCGTVPVVSKPRPEFPEILVTRVILKAVSCLAYAVSRSRLERTTGRGDEVRFPPLL